MSASASAQPAFYISSHDTGAVLSEGPIADLLEADSSQTPPTPSASREKVVADSPLPSSHVIVVANVPPSSTASVAAVPPSVPSAGMQVPAWLPAACIERARHPQSQPATALFYSRQDSLLNAYSRASAATSSLAGDHAATVAALEVGAARRLLVAAHVVNFCFAANALLLGSNIFVAAWSGSLAVVASAIDCALDLISSGIIFCTARKQAKPEPYAYPVGKARLEPLSIVVFASVMGMAALDLMVESLRTLIYGSRGSEGPVIDSVAIAVLCAAVAVKLLLAAVCWRLRGISDSIVALAQEYRNDVVMNGSTICAVLLSSRVPELWWLDASAAIGIAILMLVTWSRTGAEHIAMLAGKVADSATLSELIFIALHHDTRITHVETMRAYYSGAKLLVEVDIVLPQDMPLHVAHDIGESLQVALERLSNVERAFVHVDYAAHHAAVEHTLSI